MMDCMSGNAISRVALRCVHKQERYAPGMTEIPQVVLSPTPPFNELIAIALLTCTICATGLTRARPAVRSRSNAGEPRARRGLARRPRVARAKRLARQSHY